VKGLTPRQAEVYVHLTQCFANRGYPPSVRELAKFLGVSSTCAAEFLIALERKGFISREPGVARGIRLLPAGEAA
jgi:repressor LexA